MRTRYKEYLRLNRNLFLAASAAFIMAAITAQLVAKSASYLNTSVTLAAEYSVFFSIFGWLQFRGSKKRYALESGQLDWKRFRFDLIKLVTSLGVGEIVYTVLRWLSQYYLLTQSIEPYLASIISSITSFCVYLTVVNLTVKATRLY